MHIKPILILLSAIILLSTTPAQAQTQTYSSPDLKNIKRWTDSLDQTVEAFLRIGYYNGAFNYLDGMHVTKVFDPTNTRASFPDDVETAKSYIDQLPASPAKSFLTAHLYNQLAMVYARIGSEEKSLRFSLKALAGLQPFRFEVPAEYRQLLLRLGETYLLLGIPDSAARLLAFPGDDTRLQPGALEYDHLSALIASQKKQCPTAIADYEKCLAIFEPTGLGASEYYEMAQQLGSLYVRTGQAQRADSILEKNYRRMYSAGYRSVVLEKTVETLIANDIFTQRFDTAANLLIKLGRFMITHTNDNSKGLSEDDDLFFAARLDKLLDLYYTLLYDKKTTIPTMMMDMMLVELQRKNFVAANKADLRIHTSGYWNVDIPLPYRKWRKTWDIIDSLYAMPAADRTFDLDSLDEIGESYERKIAIRSFGQGGPGDKSKFDVMGFMPVRYDGSTTANIEYVRFNHLTRDSLNGTPMYAALEFTYSFNTAAFIPLCSEYELLKLMTGQDNRILVNQALAHQLYDKHSSVAPALYQLIWAPIEPHLSRMYQIAYSPAGIITNISFNGLYNGTARLTDKYQFHCFNSLIHDASDTSGYTKPAAVHIWDNMNYDTASGEKTRPQPPAATKGLTIAPFQETGPSNIHTLDKLFSAKGVQVAYVEGDSATEDLFKEKSRELAGVLFLSTHGFYCRYDRTKVNDPLPGNYISAIPAAEFRCGLVFSGANYYWENGLARQNHVTRTFTPYEIYTGAYNKTLCENGILTGREIQQLNLSKTRLVILSACETALGDNTNFEGNLGLQRAFRLAGVHYLIVSQWEVPAAATSTLFINFFSNWLKGESMQQSLTHAQQTVAGNPATADPFYWAAFVLIE
jgi:tetratricopeptide (TPR) repeat protein